MAQLTIYLDAEAERLIERAAKRESVSLSRWAREKLVLAAGAETWPEGYESVLGSLRDPSFCAPDELSAGLDQTADLTR